VCGISPDVNEEEVTSLSKVLFRLPTTKSIVMTSRFDATQWAI
jgi:hypothetical protein